MMLALAAAALLAASPAGVRMTVLGDSLALGVGASDSSNSFAFLLYKRVLAQAPGSEMTNLSIGGATASDVTRLEVPRVAVTSPDVILLCVGANDVVRFHSRAAFARDYGALVHALRAAAPRAKLVIFNIPDVAVSPIFDARARAAYSALARDDNREIEQAARESGAAVVDFYGFTGVQGANTAHFLSDDQFHPSDEGYAELARKSWPAVEREMGTALRGRTYTPRANP